MTRRGARRVLGTLAGSGAVLFAIAVGCEPQDIYLFDEPEVDVEQDAGNEPEPEPEPEPDAEPPLLEAPECASEACEECREDGRCNGRSPIEFCHPVTGSCAVACDAEAAPGDSPCPGTLRCKPEIRLCVECVGNDDCSEGSLRDCDPARDECVGCVDDCAAAGLVCLESEQLCVQCEVDGDCAGLEERTLCLPGDYVCVECRDATDCVADPTRPICSMTEHECEDEED